MTRVRYVHWEDEGFHLGYLEDYPDYVTQGTSEDELKENLKDLYKDLTAGTIPYARKTDELVLS
jgi:predicted RNase H-like HicB family nuclease